MGAYMSGAKRRWCVEVSRATRRERARGRSRRFDCDAGDPSADDDDGGAPPSRAERHGRVSVASGVHLDVPHALHYTTVHYSTVHNSTIHTLHYNIVQYITLYYIILYYSTLHYITLHYITLDLDMPHARAREPRALLEHSVARLLERTPGERTRDRRCVAARRIRIDTSKQISVVGMLLCYYSTALNLRRKKVT